MDKAKPFVILGGGPAGYVAAIRAAQLGSEVLLVEEDALGGVCMNQGCIPTKALLKSSGTAALVRGSKEFGVESKLERFNWQSAVQRKNRIVKNLHMGLRQLMDANGITVLPGTGRLLSERELEVQSDGGYRRIVFDKLLIATGSEVAKPPIPGVHLPGVMTSAEALDLTEIPESIIIIGAGVIGVEFASMYRAAGSKVTLLESAPHILPEMDAEISGELHKHLKRQGIAVRPSVHVVAIEQNDARLSVRYISDGKETDLPADKVLLATGRIPRSDVGIEFPTNNRAILVDERMETGIKGIYAAGDVIGGYQLAHLAYAEGKVAAENALGYSGTVNYNAVPSCIYTTPEIAVVGLTEVEAAKQAIAVRTGTCVFRTNGRALTRGERDGFVKVVANKDNIIIGAQMIGAEASELISELTLAITLGANAAVLADMIHPHPTMSEAVWEACGNLLGRGVHSLNL